MRKIVSLLLVAGFTLMMLSAAFATYPDNLNGNPNYILAGANQGNARYVVRDSLDVKKYAPPEYILATDVVLVPDADMGKTEISSRTSHRFNYNYDERKMYVDTGGKWTYLDPDKLTSTNMITATIGEIAFYLAYKIPFYGKKLDFDESFYKKI